MIDFLGKMSLRSKSAYKIGKYLLMKLLIFGKIGLYYCGDYRALW